MRAIVVAAAEGLTMDTEKLLPLPDYLRQDLSHMNHTGMREAVTAYAHANVAQVQAERDELREQCAWLSGKLSDIDRDTDERIQRYTENLRHEVRALREDKERFIKHITSGVMFAAPAPISFDSTILARAERAEAERDAARAERDELARFIRKTLTDGPFQGCDVDGGAYQDEAEARGFLHRVDATEPCSENCACAEFGFPTYCLRFTDKLATITDNREKE